MLYHLLQNIKVLSNSQLSSVEHMVHQVTYTFNLCKMQQCVTIS